MSLGGSCEGRPLSPLARQRWLPHSASEAGRNGQVLEPIYRDRSERRPLLERWRKAGKKMRDEYNKAFLASIDPDGATIAQLRAGNATLRALLAEWLAECECAPVDMPDNIHERTRAAIAPPKEPAK